MSNCCADNIIANTMKDIFWKIAHSEHLFEGLAIILIITVMFVVRYKLRQRLDNKLNPNPKDKGNDKKEN